MIFFLIRDKLVFIMLSLIFLLLSISSGAYFVLINLASPGTVLGTIFGFSAVWFWIAVFFALLFVLEKRNILKTICGKISKRIKIILIFLFGAGVLISGLNLFFICNPRLSDGKENVRYVIVLGGGITKDAKLTDSVQNRVRVASEYLKAHPASIAVVTGGKGKFSPCPESDVLKPVLASYGIDENRILAENKAKDTIQNFMFSAKLFAEHDGISVEEVLASPVAVVTSDFHIARAERLASRMGFSDVYGVASKTPPLFVLNSYCREICCYVKLNLRILLTGKPKHL